MPRSSSDTASARNSPSESQRRWFSSTSCLHVLRRRAAGTGFVHAATGHQRHDRQHLGAGAQLHDREQVGQVVAQDVAGDRDGVQAADHALQRVAHGAHLRHDLDVQAGGVVVLQVGLDLLDQLVLVRTVRVQPEDGRHAGVARARDGQLDPVADRRVLDLAHAPDVAGFDVLRSAALRRWRGRRCWPRRLRGSRRSCRASRIPRPAAPSGRRWARCPWSSGRSCRAILQKLIISW